MKKIILTIVGLLVLIVVYFLISPLFIDKVVNEPFPIPPFEVTIPEDYLPEDPGEISKQMVGVPAPTTSGKDLAPWEKDPEPIILAEAKLYGADDFHQGEGTVKVISIGYQQYLRFEEDFSVTNGPDLYVYLGKNGKVEKSLSLGKLKGNKGSQNYQIPVDASILDTNQVIIWCRAFDTNFAIADLSS